MSNFNIRRFAQAEVLKSVSKENLLHLFQPYEVYFSSHNIFLDNIVSE